MFSLSVKPNEWILDMGCGEGVYCMEIALKGAWCVGMDIDTESIRKAFNISLRTKMNGKTFFIVGDVRHLPFRGYFFDKAICVEVLEYIQNYSAAIREARRVLKGAGLLVLPVPKANGTWYLIDGSQEFSFRRRDKEFTLVKKFTESEMISLLESNGFSAFDILETFKVFGSVAWELHHKFHFHWSLFPVLFGLSRLDGLLRSRRGNELHIVARK